VTQAPSRSARVRDLVPPLLRERGDFRRLWTGQTISVIGDQVTSIGLPLVAVSVLGADAAQMGWLTAAGLLPHLFFSLPAGVWLDRVHRRRRLMIWADLGRAFLLATIPLAFVLDRLGMAQLYVVAFLAGTLAVAFDVAWNTVFVAVVPRERFVNAMALLNGSRSIASVAGPSIGGILVQVIGAPLALLADAVSYLGSVFALRGMHAAEPPVEPAVGGLRAQTIEGLQFIARDPIMRPVLLSAATINLFNFAVQALFILYVTTFLGVNAGVLGLTLGVGAVGSILGALVASRIGRRFGLGPAYALGCVVFPASLLLIPLADPAMPMPLILVMLGLAEFGAGFGVMILDINVGALMTARVPDRIRSRTAGSFRVVNYGIRPIGALLGGVLGTALGVREGLWAATIASLLGVFWLVGTRIPRQRDLPEVAE
jgi:MFS family permease